MKTYSFTTTDGSTVDPAVAVVNGVATVDINLTVTEDGHSQSFMWARAGQAVSAARLAEARQVALGSTALLTGTLTTTLDTVQASAHATRYLPAGATTGTVRGAQNLGTDVLTIAPQGTDTIDGGPAPYEVGPGKVIRFQSDGSGAWVEYASSGSGAAAVPDGSITLPKLSTGVQTSIGKADGSAQKASNLSDVASAGTARTNLGLGTAATQASTAFDAAGAATAAQAASVQKASNLSDVASAATARTNLGLGSAAVMTPTSIAADTALTGTYAALPARAQGALTGWFYPEAFGVITYGKGVTQAQATANAAAMQAAIDAANNSGGIAANTTGGGTVWIGGVIECYTPAAVAALTLYGGVHLRGVGSGGDVFSGTDANLPYRGSVLRLWSGANQDLVRTANFAALTGSTSPSAYATPERFSIRDLVLDGNSAGNTSGLPLRIYGRTYQVSDVTIQNGVDGGAYSEWGAGGYEMEARWSNFTITDCAGIGLEWRGPHDSQFINGTVGHAASGATHGIKLVAGAAIGGEQFTNVHVWGAYTTHLWEIGTSNGYFTNCTSDGGGVCFTGSGNTWDGTIYGTNTPGQYAVKIGDTATRTIGQNTVRGRVFNFKGSPYAVQTLTTTNTANRFQATANLNFAGSSGYLAKGLPTTTTSPAVSSDTVLNVASTANLPSSGTLFADDGTNRTGSLAFTGKTSTTLTGVTGIPAGGLATGAAVYLQSTQFGTSDFGGDQFEVFDYGNSSSFGVWRLRATPNSDSVHNTIMRVGGRIFADEGTIVATNSGSIGNTLKAGSGAPSFSGTAGDLWFRTDTPGTANQRTYINTGTTNWTPLDPAVSPTFAPTGLTGAAAVSRYAGAPASGTFAVGDFVIDQGGTVWICTTAGTPGTWTVLKPVDPLAAALGYINWNWNPTTGGAGTALTSQRADVAAIWLPPGVPVANVYLNVTTAGTSTAPTGFFVGLCSTSKMLAQSNNLASSSSLTATGAKPFALNATYTTSLSDSPTGLYYVAILQNGAFAGTNVAFQRGNASTPGYAINNGTTFGNIGTSLTGFVSNASAVTVSNSAGLGWHVGVA